MKRNKRWNRRYETNILRLARLATEEDIIQGTEWYMNAYKTGM